MTVDLNELLQQVPGFFLYYGMKIIIACLVLFIGKWLAGLVVNAIERALIARSVDITVSGFIKNILYYTALTVVIIAALAQLGIQTASFVAIIGAAGLAIGFALQGSLANFAAGVLLISFRPFKKGDYVDVAGASGAVEEISIFSTTLLTPDNKTVIITNAAIMSDNITNYSTRKQRRIDLVIGVSYLSDIKQVKEELNNILSLDARILSSPEPTVAVAELASSSVNFAVRPWVKTPDYWAVYFDLNERIKLHFDQVGIEIPFDQLDINLNHRPDCT